MSNPTTTKDGLSSKPGSLLKGLNQVMAASGWEDASNGDMVGENIDDNEDADGLKDILGGLSGFGGGFLGNFLEEDINEWDQGREDDSTKNVNQPSIGVLPVSSSKSSKAPFYMSYQQFITHLEQKNNGRVGRNFAEKAWKSSCEATYKKWKPDAEISTEMKELSLRNALAQMNGGLNGQFDIEKFWSNKKEMYKKKIAEEKKAQRMARKEHFRKKNASPSGSTTQSGPALAAYVPRGISSRKIDESYDE
ncbi:hypothetical protein BKA61DRAFT_664682 [Leptodontidium sp. MPI-SDFR-AT-0119]|nr:hypothetical protein BKA61DRAFT_664682 [Leptodontidium sp. MPI-SDFR-AT-0119]